MSIKKVAVGQPISYGIQIGKKVLLPNLGKSTVPEVSVQLPQMALEAVIPKKNIINSVQKAINDFKDIRDTETIERICSEWRRELDEIIQRFSLYDESTAQVYEKHRKAITSLNKYGEFSDKLCSLAAESGDAEFVNKIFERYLEPNMLYSQKAMKIIDNLPCVRKAYNLAS